MIKCSLYFVYEVKINQNLHQRRKVKIYMCSDTLNGKNFWKICVTLQWHIDPFLRKWAILIGDPFPVTASFLEVCCNVHHDIALMLK